MAVAGYDKGVVFGFLAAVGQFDDDGTLTELNGLSVGAEHRMQVHKWLRSRSATVLLNPVDKLLMKHGLMTWELEHWGEIHMGDDGFRASTEPVRSAA